VPAVLERRGKVYERLALDAGANARLGAGTRANKRACTNEVVAGVHLPVHEEAAGAQLRHEERGNGPLTRVGNQVMGSSGGAGGHLINNSYFLQMGI
jgi:hypothetical protein